LPERQ